MPDPYRTLLIATNVEREPYPVYPIGAATRGLKGEGNRQGSEGFLSAREGVSLSGRETELQSLAREVYEEMTRSGRGPAGSPVSR